MSRSITILTLLAGLGFFPNSLWASPEIAVNTVERDLGKVLEGTELNLEFHLRNTGDDVLRIYEVSGSSILMSFDYHDYYLPGHERAMSVTIPTDGYRGKFERRFTIYSNDPKFSAVKFTIRAYIVRPLLLQPREINAFNLEQSDEPYVGGIYIRGHERYAREFAINRIWTDKDFIRVTLERRDENRYVIRYWIDTQKAWKWAMQDRSTAMLQTESASSETDQVDTKPKVLTFSANLYFETDDPKLDVYKVPVTGSVLAPGVKHEPDEMETTSVQPDE